MPFIQSAFTEHVICANIVVNHPASQAVRETAPGKL